MFHNLFGKERLDLATIDQKLVPYLNMSDFSTVLIGIIHEGLDNGKQEELMDILKCLEARFESLEEVLMIGVAKLVEEENSPTLSIAGKVKVINYLMELQNEEEGSNKLNLTGYMPERLAQIIIQVIIYTSIVQTLYFLANDRFMCC